MAKREYREVASFEKVKNEDVAPNLVDYYEKRVGNGIAGWYEIV